MAHGANRGDSSMMTGVVSNTVKSDGTVNSVVKVRAPIQQRAERKATNMALLHNGLSKTLLNANKVSVDIKRADPMEDAFGYNIYEVELVIEGLE